MGFEGLVSGGVGLLLGRAQRRARSLDHGRGVVRAPGNRGEGEELVPSLDKGRIRGLAPIGR
jgi:hypothetical protein